MSEFVHALWLSTSPSLQWLDQPLLRYLAKQLPLSAKDSYPCIAQWEYQQTLDEASSLDMAVRLLAAHLQDYPNPVHLFGHGISGVVGLLCSRRCPDRVKSLTLLSVAAQPAITWQSHYYVQRTRLPCSQAQILKQMARCLVGDGLACTGNTLAHQLNDDLIMAPGLHSLLRQISTLPRGGVTMPLMVCSSETDGVVAPPDLLAWQADLKPQDCLWLCPEGRHFFHYFYPQLVGDRILAFWQRQTLSQSDPSTYCSFNPLSTIDPLSGSRAGGLTT